MAELSLAAPGHQRNLLNLLPLFPIGADAAAVDVLPQGWSKPVPRHALGERP